ncbi:hypothetical protein POREN0001_1382 [Porphyromonas endodontalis ATCC 35406]|uniref:Uncharacterized protein n=1 Tax=Porphyromonas endodontalis (strain ATCC 35406 / DSM 24491 / JCM 8526 / CCUG 16442 / BCRC 14492 / NCTC 13058 / HG 370) TaxID=553175 RepID=C3J8D7_POREA|nr:hypothetical protein POREN0001_1382 [Porphyromonas endodontalis ATCC 35406]
MAPAKVVLFDYLAMDFPLCLTIGISFTLGKRMNASFSVYLCGVGHWGFRITRSLR